MQSLRCKIVNNLPYFNVDASNQNIYTTLDFQTKPDFTQCSSLIAASEGSNIHWSWQCPFCSAPTWPWLQAHIRFIICIAPMTISRSQTTHLCVCVCVLRGPVRGSTFEIKGRPCHCEAVHLVARGANRHAKTGLSWKALWAFEQEIVRVWDERQKDRRQEKNQSGGGSLNGFKLSLREQRLVFGSKVKWSSYTFLCPINSHQGNQSLNLVLQAEQLISRQMLMILIGSCQCLPV